MYNNSELNENIKNNLDIHNQYVSNPIDSSGISSNLKDISNGSINLPTTNNAESKVKQISEITKLIESLPYKDIKAFMANSNEIVRTIAAHHFVDRASGNIFNDISELLENKNEFLRDSAVTALCYINSVESLSFLEKVSNDSSKDIKFKALAGVADIAAENPDSNAKNILNRFLNDENEEVREFVSDELSIIG